MRPTAAVAAVTTAPAPDAAVSAVSAFAAPLAGLAALAATAAPVHLDARAGDRQPPRTKSAEVVLPGGRLGSRAMRALLCDDGGGRRASAASVRVPTFSPANPVRSLQVLRHLPVSASSPWSGVAAVTTVPAADAATGTATYTAAGATALPTVCVRRVDAA